MQSAGLTWVKAFICTVRLFSFCSFCYSIKNSMRGWFCNEVRRVNEKGASFVRWLQKQNQEPPERTVCVPEMLTAARWAVRPQLSSVRQLRLISGYELIKLLLLAQKIHIIEIKRYVNTHPRFVMHSDLTGSWFETVWRKISKDILSQGKLPWGDSCNGLAMSCEL